MLKRVSSARILILVSLVFMPFRLMSQNSQDLIIDTSDYIPIFYEGGLEYNLIMAASKGYSSEIERMVLMGADVDAETQEGATPLIFAVANNKLDAVNTLIYYGANVNKKTSAYETPLLIAVRQQNLEIAEALLRNDADINFQDNHGATPLLYSCIDGFFYITDLLLYYEADTDRKDIEGTTPLMAAIWSGYPEIADLLIQNGANMEARDNDGFTPFLIASQNGDTTIMQMLLKKGVDIYEKNKYNWDALTLAIKSGQLAATELLLSKGDKWTSPERDGVDPYSVAVNFRRKEIIDLLKKHSIIGRQKRGFDQMELMVYSRFNFKDIYSGLGLAFKEPALNAGLVAGFDTKLWYTKVLIKQDESLYYQYMDKSSVAYAGLFKEFPLTDNLFRSNLSMRVSLSAGYSFGNKFKGTDIVPSNKFRIMPSLGIRWTKGNYILFSYVDYMQTEFYKIGPLWARIGLAYNFFFDYFRAPSKDIKWY